MTSYSVLHMRVMPEDEGGEKQVNDRLESLGSYPSGNLLPNSIKAKIGLAPQQLTLQRHEGYNSTAKVN